MVKTFLLQALPNFNFFNRRSTAPHPVQMRSCIVYFFILLTDLATQVAISFFINVFNDFFGSRQSKVVLSAIHDLSKTLRIFFGQFNKIAEKFTEMVLRDTF